MERERVAFERANKSDRAAMEAATKLEGERRLWEELKGRLKQSNAKSSKRASEADTQLAALK
eukprot:463652-Prorocentrum_minimum.AAC.1